MDDLDFSCLSKGAEPTWASEFTFHASLVNVPTIYPNATWRDSSNFWTGRNGYKPIAIVNHIMAGSMESADSWFLNPASEVSAHFGVARDGRVYQWVSLDNSAWANGIMGKPTTSIDWINECYTKGINPNLRTISIEHEGQTGQIFTAEQFLATLNLQKWLVAQYNIPIDRVHLVRHADIDSVNRPYCPGNAYPWDALISGLSPVVKPPTPPAFDPNPLGYSVGSGMLSELTARQEQAATSEQYYIADGNKPGLAKRSFVWTRSGKMLVAFQDWKDPNQWEVQCFSKLP